MCGVARENDTAMAEPFHAATLKRIDRYPFQLEIDISAQHCLKAGHNVFGLLFFFLVDVPAQLQINAPDPVGLLVQQGRLPAVERVDQTRTSVLSEIRRP